jgi:MotA/TolQ/ExbB proton channel family
MKLFVKWHLINTLSVLTISSAMVIGWQTFRSSDVIAQAFVVAALLIYIAASVKCGFLSFHAGRAQISFGAFNFHRKAIVHEADFIRIAAEISPLVGLLGAGTGIYLSLTANTQSLDQAHLQQVVFNCMRGAGVAFLPTITGIFVCASLLLQHWTLTHGLSHEEK